MAHPFRRKGCDLAGQALRKTVRASESRREINHCHALFRSSPPSGAVRNAALAEDAPGNPEAGQRVFNQCRACHTVNQGGRATVGPNLFGIVGPPRRFFRRLPLFGADAPEA